MATHGVPHLGWRALFWRDVLSRPSPGPICPPSAKSLSQSGTPMASGGRRSSRNASELKGPAGKECDGASGGAGNAGRCSDRRPGSARPLVPLSCLALRTPTHGGFGGAPKFPTAGDAGVRSPSVQAHRRPRGVEDGHANAPRHGPRRGSTITWQVASIDTPSTPAGWFHTSKKCCMTMPCSDACT